MNLTAQIAVQTTLQPSKTIGALTPAVAVAVNQASAFTSGVGAGQVNQLLVKTNTALAAGATDTIDVNGALNDIFGDSIVMVRIWGIVLRNLSTDATSHIQFGAAGSNPVANIFLATTNAINVRTGGGTLALMANSSGGVDVTGYAVTAATADILAIKNLSGSATASYELYVIGCTA